MVKPKTALITIFVSLLTIVGGCPPPEEGRITPPADDFSDMPSGATALSLGQSIQGTIDHAGDVDYFSFSAQRGWVYVIETTGSTDTYLTLYGADGSSEITSDDDGGNGTNARIEWTASAAGTYFLRVRHFSSTGTGSYRLALSATAPERPEETGRLILNANAASRHAAHAELADGAEFDYWVQRTEDGTMYLSDLRARTPQQEQYYVQFDSLGRPTFFEDASGASVRVNFYLANGQADITVTLPDGRSVRGVISLAELADEDGRAKALVPNFTKDALRSQASSAGAADFVSVVNKLRDMICQIRGAYWLGQAIGALVLIGGCVGSATFDAVTFPTVAETVAGCAASAGARELVIRKIEGLIVCRGLEFLLDRAETALREPLGEADPPVPPSQTGDVELGTGSVHVTLTWGNATDVDLHVIDPSGEEVYYRHPRSASGGELDVDDRDGYGPENIFWPEGGAPSGQYSVAVVYYSSYGRGPSNYVVTVRYPGRDGQQIIREYSGTLAFDGERHTITTFTVGSDGGGGGSGGGGSYPESPHPYPNNYDNEWTYTLSGTHASIDVTFDPQTETEAGWDYIYVMDAAGNNISGSPFTGTELAGRTVRVPGSTVRIRLTTDRSVTRWGFRITSVRSGD